MPNTMLKSTFYIAQNSSYFRYRHLIYILRGTPTKFVVNPLHQKMYKNLSTFSGIFSSFPVAEKFASDAKNVNSHTGRLFGNLS
jgi:hypothetical protein